LHSVYVELREHCLRSSIIKAAPAGALLLLCLLWSLASLRPDLLPRSASEANASPLLNQASILALFAIVAAATAFVQKANWPRGRTLLEAGLVGAGLLALPALLVELAKGQVDDSTRVALFSLVPIGAVVVEPYLGSPLQSPQRGGFAAALVAVAGTLLIFPLELPRASAQAVAFCGVIAAVASIASANCTAVKIAQGQTTLSGFATIAAGSAAILLAIAGLSIERSARPIAHIDAWAIPDLLSLALLFWLMSRMSAVRMTTRFLIAPLVANLIALAFLRPGVQLRGWLGLLLMALASGWLLFTPEDEPDKTGSPLTLA
jgi:drug/metabolite transporter (DMT)-like permease